MPNYSSKLPARIRAEQRRAPPDKTADKHRALRSCLLLEYRSREMIIVHTLGTVPCQVSAAAYPVPGWIFVGRFIVPGLELMSRIWGPNFHSQHAPAALRRTFLGRKATSPTVWCAVVRLWARHRRVRGGGRAEERWGLVVMERGEAKYLERAPSLLPFFLK